MPRDLDAKTSRRQSSAMSLIKVFVLFLMRECRPSSSVFPENIAEDSVHTTEAVIGSDDLLYDPERGLDEETLHQNPVWFCFVDD